jgi:hypothetical protein
MKKFILTLSALFTLSLSGFGQANISVEAPRYDENYGTWGALTAPNGSSSAVYHRAVWYISQYEMSRMVQTNSVITSFGLDIFRTGSPSATGQFSLYLQNTSDVQYNKSLTFATALTGMALTYTGNATIPASGTPASPTAAVNVNLTTPFTYTGGGLYVAWDWYGAAANSTVFARYFGNFSLLTNGGGFASAPAAGPAPTAITAYPIRPVMRFIAGNTATNDISVVRLNAPGYVTRLAGPHTITAQVRNNGTVTVNNVAVTLSVTGANPFTNTQSVTTIAAGGVGNVTFNYNPTANGTSSMIAFVAPDQYSANDTSFVWTQSVSCSDFANTPPDAAASFSDAGYGYGAAAMLVTPITPVADATLSAIKFAMYNGQTAMQMCGALLDNGGNILAMTRTINLAGVTPQVYTTFRFDTLLTLTAGTQYYFGMAQLASGFPFGISESGNLKNFPNQYFNAPIAGGSIGGVQNQMHQVPMIAVLNYSNTYITAEASTTVSCNNKAGVSPTQTIMLTATGANGLTYAWSPGVPTASNTATIIITPSLSAAQGTINYQVVATDAGTSCKSNTAIVTVSVSLNRCTGIVDNGDFGSTISVFPNPTVNGKVTVKGLEGNNNITVLNIIGQAVINTKSSESEITVDLGSMPSGNYFLKITNAKGQTYVTKVLN